MYYDLEEAKLPDAFMDKVKKAHDVLWDAFNAEFTEVTSGDSQMCDEPANSIAVWLAPYSGVTLPELTVAQYSLSLPKGCSDERVEKTVDLAINDMMTVLKDDLPNLQKPNSEVRELLLNIYSDVLHWNFPEKKTSKKHI
jgi:hypothetical protein